MIKNITYIEEKQHCGVMSQAILSKSHSSTAQPSTITWLQLTPLKSTEGMVSRRKQTKANISILNVFTLPDLYFSQ